MRVFRRVLISSAIVGAAITTFTQPNDLRSVPFPGSKLYINMPATIRSSGEYYLMVEMPIVEDSAAMPPETVSCDFAYSVHKDKAIAWSESIHSINRIGEIGSAHMYEYRAGTTFHLDSGEYQVTLTGGTGCPAASIRGASVVIDQDVVSPTEHYIVALLLKGLARILLFGGLIGLLIIEFRSREKSEKIVANE